MLVMPVFLTPMGVKQPIMTKHFLERYCQRFPGLSSPDMVRHITKAMLKSVVINGLEGADPATYFLWDADTDRIVVMAGYMDSLVTCYSAATSEWFCDKKCREGKWPTFREVFGCLRNADDGLSQAEFRKRIALVGTRDKRFHDDYLNWYQAKSVVRLDGSVGEPEVREQNLEVKEDAGSDQKAEQSE